MDNQSNEQENISQLKAYVASRVHDLAVENNLLIALDDITSTFVDKISDSSSVMSDEKASDLIAFHSENIHKDDNLDEDTYIKLRKLARTIIDIAIETDNNDKRTHADLLKAAFYVCPLLTRDNRTDDLGFEIQEYTDYFVNLDKDDRKKFGKELLAEWQDNGII
jgi:hypothetical protein